MKTKKLIRKITSVLLAVIMTFCLASASYAAEPTGNTASLVTESNVARAGTETVSPGSGCFGNFYLQNNNLTPVKTMGASGTFSLFGTATCSSSKYWQICIQILDAYTGNVLKTTYTTGSSYNHQYYSMDITVTKGQKIQIFTYYTSTPSTEAEIYLDYILEWKDITLKMFETV